MKYLGLVCFVLLMGKVNGQHDCEMGQSELIIEIKTDNYGYETYWLLEGVDGTLYASVAPATYASRTLYRDTICLPEATCMQFTMRDNFGDGLDAPGYYLLRLNGDTIQQGGDFGAAALSYFQCKEGEVCTQAISIEAGQYKASLEDTWYIFTPDTSGIYRFSTCGLNTCDTKIWIYNKCEGITISEDNQSTILFNDDESPCAPQALLTGYLEKSKPYFIRIGDKEKDCTDTITWALSFDGVLKGCRDPTACNYNPLAIVDDGSCLPQGHPNCPVGPDLFINQDSLQNSIFLDTIHSGDPCLIEEGCLQGYGIRDIMRFTTHIENIGEADYFIGQPNTNNPQFTWNNCHNHFHYDSYAEYLLFKEDGSTIPIGFKNGFCVTDFGCPPGISPKFACDNMGISANCYDTYWAALECQWIDLTDVPDGRYTFVVRINWKNQADATGKFEQNILNNWAQVCILLDRSSGRLVLSQDENCQPFTDCAGLPYGNTLIDCEGVCNGTALSGDVDQNGIQEMRDVDQYLLQILIHDLAPSPCYDLNADSLINVYDASLLANCLNYGAAHQHTGYGAHNHCLFPSGIVNTNDTVSLQLLDANWEEKWIDVGMQNPKTQVNAFQFQISGLHISHVESLVPTGAFPVSLSANMSDGTVIGISLQDSLIDKSQEFQPLCRIYYLERITDTICLQQIAAIVNANQEQVATQLVQGCAVFEQTTATFFPTIPILKISPNPFTEVLRIEFFNPRHERFRFELLDLNGRVVAFKNEVEGELITLARGSLSSGMYWFRLLGQNGYASGRLIAL